MPFHALPWPPLTLPPLHAFIQGIFLDANLALILILGFAEFCTLVFFDRREMTVPFALRKALRDTCVNVCSLGFAACVAMLRFLPSGELEFLTTPATQNSYISVIVFCSVLGSGLFIYEYFKNRRRAEHAAAEAEREAAIRAAKDAELMNERLAHRQEQMKRYQQAKQEQVNKGVQQRGSTDIEVSPLRAQSLRIARAC